jgi:hypothetical protein
MLNDEETLEVDISEIDINYAKAMASYHHEMMMEHRRIANNAAAECRRPPSVASWANISLKTRREHELAENLHRLCAELYRNGHMEDAHWFSLAAERLNDRLELGGWK